MATPAAAGGDDPVNAKIGTAAHVVIDVVAAQSWPLSAPATLWLAIGALGLLVGLRGIWAARRLGEQPPSPQPFLTDAPGMAADTDSRPVRHAARHAEAGNSGGGRMRPSTGVSVTTAPEPAPR